MTPSVTDANFSSRCLKREGYWIFGINNVLAVKEWIMSDCPEWYFGSYCTTLTLRVPMSTGDRCVSLMFLMFKSKLWTPEIFLEWFFVLQWDLDILNEPLYNKVLAIANNFLYPSNNKIYEKEPWYKETSATWTNFVGPSTLCYIEVLLYKERVNQAW